MKQLYTRDCFALLYIEQLTESEKKKIVDAIMLLQEKRDKTIKGRCVYNGKPTRDWLMHEDTSSPTALLESVMLTAAVDAHENRDVMTADVPNAFVQTGIPKTKDGEDRIIMKITGVLVDYLVEIAPEVYGKYVVFQNGKRYYMYKY